MVIETFETTFAALIL